MRATFLLTPLALSAALVTESFDPSARHGRNSINTPSLYRTSALLENLAFIAASSPNAAAAPADAPTSREKVAPKIRSTAHREKIRWGPIILPPANSTTQPKAPTLMPTMDPAGIAFTRAISGLPLNATYLAGDVKLTLADGTAANLNQGAYLHHILLIDVSKKSSPLSFCIGANSTRDVAPMSVFLGTGNDNSGGWMFTDPLGEFNSGFYVGGADRMMMVGEIVSYANETREVFVEAEVEWEEGRREGMLDTKVATISATGCGSVSFEAPGAAPNTSSSSSSSPSSSSSSSSSSSPEAGAHAGTGTAAAETDTHASASGHAAVDAPPAPQTTAFNYTGVDYRLAFDGLVLQQRGHLHDGGARMLAYLNGSPICTSSATYGGELGTLVDASTGEKMWETIIGMENCLEPVEVKKGDVLRLVAEYDPGSHPLRVEEHGGMAEEMGIVSWYFVTRPEGVGEGYVWPRLKAEQTTQVGEAKMDKGKGKGCKKRKRQAV